MRQACLNVGFSSCKKGDNIPGGPIWMLRWLPSGHAPTKEDRLLAVFFDTDDKWNDFGFQSELTATDREEGKRLMPPLLRVVKEAIEKHLREHPEDAAGHLESKDWSTVKAAPNPTLLERGQPFAVHHIAGLGEVELGFIPGDPEN